MRMGGVLGDVGPPRIHFDGGNAADIAESDKTLEPRNPKTHRKFGFIVDILITLSKVKYRKFLGTGLLHISAAISALIAVLT